MVTVTCYRRIKQALQRQLCCLIVRRKMQLLTVIFPSASVRDDYPRLLSALRTSVEIHSPETPLVIVEAAADTRIQSIHTEASPKARASFVANTQKMRLWQEAVESLPDGEVLCLLDADTMVTRDLGDAARMPFDVTYTARPATSKFPINSGVVLVRGGARARAFFQRWRDVNEAMLGDPAYHQEYREVWGGINQAALGAMIADPGDVDLLRTDCREWNCEDTTWKDFDPALTRIVHVKGRLRQVCLGRQRADKVTRPLCELWRGMVPTPAAEI
jgi:hypothetical protein